MPKLTTAYFSRFILFLLFISLALSQITLAKTNDSDIPLPPGLQYSISPNDRPEYILNTFLGIPYRVNGAIDEQGHYTWFSKPNVLAKSSGLNCSGFVLSASRFLLGENIPLSAAIKDRLADSGIDSINGEDWDFGWDLINNIAEHSNGVFLLPGGQSIDKSDGAISGLSPRGYDLHNAATWIELPQRLKPGFVYLVSFNKGTAQHGNIKHYHVALIHVNDQGVMWLYQTTGGSRKIYKRNLSDQQQRSQFLRSFANTGNVKKYILILEIPLPK